MRKSASARPAGQNTGTEEKETYRHRKHDSYATPMDFWEKSEDFLLHLHRRSRGDLLAHQDRCQRCAVQQRPQPPEYLHDDLQDGARTKIIGVDDRQIACVSGADGHVSAQERRPPGPRSGCCNSIPEPPDRAGNRGRKFRSRASRPGKWPDLFSAAEESLARLTAGSFSHPDVDKMNSATPPKPLQVLPI